MSISLRDLSVSYGSTEILDRVSFDVATNEWLGLLGPNGAGKSTLLKAVAGLIPSTGDIAVDGESLPNIARKDLAKQIAYVPQEPIMPFGMRVVEYVLLGRTPHLPYLGTERREDVEAARRALELLDLGPFVDRPVDDLSGGERQRVVLARALAQESSILLLDEPTSALDIGHRQQALELIGSVRASRPMTIITAMHDLTLAGQFADRLGMLAHGSLVADGPASEVLTVANIADHYDAAVEVLGLADGGVAVVPIRGGR